MNKFIICFFCISFATKLFSQSNEIGVSVLSYKGFNVYNKQKDGLVLTDAQSTVMLQPVISYNHINSKDIDLNIQAGFFYLPRKIDTKTPVPGNYIYKQTGNFLQKSVFGKIGIAKRFYKEKIILISGINIPFEYCFYKESQNNSSTYLRDTIQSKTESHTTYTPEYTTSINLQQSFYYPLTKHIYLGVDLNLGLQLYIVNGVRTDKNSNDDYVNPLNNNSNEAKATYHHYIQRSLHFQPSVSIKYNFKKKNEK